MSQAWDRLNGAVKNFCLLLLLYFYIIDRVRIGRGKRTDFTRTGQVTPGPANYDIERGPKDIQHRFGSSIRKPLNTVVTPGPG